ncbi:PHD finger protein At2g01810-like [Pyrus communis]|uniref:PHD finger protein At2g01810-like n=1 Tax=Pyrus communis TaxID=23211 RepID=UPI0035BF0EAA
MAESSFGHQLQALLSRYRDFGTLKDLLSPLVGEIHEAENMKRNSRNVDDIKELKYNSKCKADKIRIAVNQFKEILGNGAPPMPRKVLREAAVDLARANKQANRPSVGATAVLDHVLSNLDNVVVDEHHIFARTTRDHNGRDVYHLQLKELPWEGQIYNEFDIDAQGESLPLTFICQIPWPNIDWRDEHHSKKIQEERESPIGDIVVVVPGDATIEDLKETTQKGLKDSYYFIKECFELSDIFLGLCDTTPASKILNDNPVKLIGDGFNAKDMELWFQGGSDHLKTFLCKCPAKEEDGERMVECDTCGNRCHTLCFKIQDDDVPEIFRCKTCRRTELESDKYAHSFEYNSSSTESGGA